MEAIEETKEESLVEFGFATDETKIIKFLNELSYIPADKPDLYEPRIFDFFSKEIIVPYMIVWTSRSYEEEVSDRMCEIKNTFFKNIVNRRHIHISLNKYYSNLIRIRESLNAGMNLTSYSEWLFFINHSLRCITVKNIDRVDSRFHKFGPSIRSICTREHETMHETIYFILPDKDIDYPIKEWASKISEDFKKRFIGGFKQKNNNKKRTPIDSRLRHECFKRDNYTCVECGSTNKEKTLHADHILPVSQGGSDELDNLQTLCEHCNLAKSNKKWKTEN